MKLRFACAAIALFACADPAAAQDGVGIAAADSARAVPVGSYLRVEYTRYFVRRREVVDSAEARRATHRRHFEFEGNVERLTATEVELRAHDRTRRIQRWQIDRAWMFVPTAETKAPGERFAEWSLGGVVAAAVLGGAALSMCSDDAGDYCGLAVLVAMMAVGGVGVISGIFAEAGDADADFVEVAL